MTETITAEEKKMLCRKMAANLPTLRAKAELSQNELAERLGFSRQTISAIETDKRDMQWSTFAAVALLLMKSEEIKELMFVMGVINECVEKSLAL